MLFTRALLIALPLIGSVLASPVKIEDRSPQVVKRDSIVTVVNNLQTSVAAPIASLNSANAAGTLTATDAQTYLTDILNAINTANSAVTGSTAKRDLTILARQSTADDLNIVGAVLAEVITDLVNAIEDIADDLQGLPLIGAIIISIDGGLNTLLLGVEIVLVGVIQILQGLLSGISGLLLSLGTGLLAGLLGF